jgi:hypothetical protein
MADRVVIYKYDLGGLDHRKVLMPQGARVLSCGKQGNSIMVWAVVDSAAPTVIRRFFVTWTGRLIEEGSFIGTILDGPYVWHVFDHGEE